MIYEQPVVYEFKNITAPTLIIIDQANRTVVGKNLLSKNVAAQHGNYPAFGMWLKTQINNAKLVELPVWGISRMYRCWVSLKRLCWIFKYISKL